MPRPPQSRKAAKQARLAAALRENLKRRKQAARAAAPPTAEASPERPNTAKKPG